MSDQDQAEALFADLNRDFYGALSQPARKAIDDIIQQLETTAFTQQIMLFACLSLVTYDAIVSLPLERRWAAETMQTGSDF